MNINVLIHLSDDVAGLVYERRPSCKVNVAVMFDEAWLQAYIRPIGAVAKIEWWWACACRDRAYAMQISRLLGQLTRQSDEPRLLK